MYLTKPRNLVVEIWEGKHSLLQEIYLGYTNESRTSIKKRYKGLFGNEGVLNIKVKERRVTND